MTTPWRLIDDLAAGRDAAGQMAADADLAAGVAAGEPPALRLYTWARPALSLGRFQPDTDVDAGACDARGVAVVRRPTGGRALLHGGDLTYAVAMPRPKGEAGGVDAVYCRLADGLRAGLALLGVEAEVSRHEGEAGAACFGSQRGSDLRVGTRKLVGSAQVHREGVVLQHGSILLRRLEFDEVDLLALPDPAGARAALRAATVTLEELGAPTDPEAVAGALTRGFAEALDLDFRSNPVVAAPAGRR